MAIQIERNKFPLQTQDEVTQRYICPTCGELQTVPDVMTKKIRPENTGRYDIECPYCGSNKLMRIITPTEWVRNIDDKVKIIEALANIYAQGAFMGTRTQYNQAVANGLILDGTIVILTSNA